VSWQVFFHAELEPEFDTQAAMKTLEQRLKEISPGEMRGQGNAGTDGTYPTLNVETLRTTPDLARITSPSFPAMAV
jgi:hypothetical protein